MTREYDSEQLEETAGTAKTSRPDKNAEREELQAALRQVLSELPEVDRNIMALYYGGDVSHEEIADSLSIPKRTISFKIQRSL